MRVADEPQSRDVEPRRSAVVHLPLSDSDAGVVAAIRAGERAGGAALYDRHHQYVRRVLVRVLGPDADLQDLVQDVFVAAIDSIDRLVDAGALRGWLAAISVNCVRMELRRRTRRRIIRLFPPNELPDVAVAARDRELDAALRVTYHVLGRLPADERIVFALRFIEGMELMAIAEACQVSLATAKRRLVSGRRKFINMAKAYPELVEWVKDEAP